MTNNRNRFRLLLGAALGLGAGYYLNSKKGQNLIKDSKSYLTDQLEKSKENGKHLVENTTEYLADLSQKGRSYLRQTENTIENAQANDKIEEVVSQELDALSEKLQMKKSELESLISNISNS